MERFTPSLLDRLFEENELRGAIQTNGGVSIEEMKACVGRDIEALLNTRNGCEANLMNRFPLARESIVNFGIQDFVGLTLNSAIDRQKICQSIQDAIRRFEPRLKNVEVSLAEITQGQQNLKFSVNALLALDPAVEAISFDAFLLPVTKQYSVSMSRSASASQRAARHG